MYGHLHKGRKLYEFTFSLSYVTILITERRLIMGYQDEWMLLEAGDIIDEMEHRQP